MRGKNRRIWRTTLLTALLLAGCVLCARAEDWPQKQPVHAAWTSEGKIGQTAFPAFRTPEPSFTPEPSVMPTPSPSPAQTEPAAASASARAEELRTLEARYILAPAGSAVYARPSLDSASAPAKADVIGSVSLGSNSFYRVDRQDGGHLYVLRRDAACTVYTVKPVCEEAMIGEKEVTVYSFPKEGLGKEVGRLTPGGICAVDRQVDGFVRVRQGDVTGWAKLDQLLQPGCADKQDYYIFVNLAEMKLTVFKGDGRGGHTDQVVQEAIVTIGKKTTPTPTGHYELKKGYELWHYYGGPSYAPYAIEFAPYRWIHGELCATPDREDKRKDRENQFGKAQSGGCIRVPTDLAQWIFFHCAPGTPVEIVKGQ